MRNTTEITIKDGDLRHDLAITKMAATKMQKFLKLAAPIIARALGTVQVTKSGEDTHVHCNAFIGEGEGSVKIDLKIFAEALEELDDDKFDRIAAMLYACVQRRVDGKLIPVTSGNIDSFITTIQGLHEMQLAALSHNIDFFHIDALLKSGSASETTKVTTFNMRTSQPKSQSV